VEPNRAEEQEDNLQAAQRKYIQQTEDCAIFVKIQADPK